MKKFIKDHIYRIVFLLVLAIAIIFSLFLRYKIKYIVKQAPYLNKELNNILVHTFIFIIIILLIITILIYYIRKDILKFSERIIYVIDNIILQKYDLSFEINEETILSKTENKLKHLVEVMKDREEKYEIEKNSIKSLISDISHQIKTPIANITMYNDTLIDRKLSESNRLIFLNNMKSQINKLEWLIQALIKMSRLENGIIKLNLTEYEISETIAQALSSIYLKAEKKNISVRVNCHHSIKAFYDPKWTSEAIFNLLDNAVKYTYSGGNIKISVESWELFTKIDIMDSGMGIDKEEINNIFKRFYRIKSVSTIDGVGIGLYLSREIISMEGGYIKVNSQKGVGSIFSIFLPNSIM